MLNETCLMTIPDSNTGNFVRQDEVCVETSNIGHEPSGPENHSIEVRLSDVGEARCVYPLANADHCMAIDDLDTLKDGSRTVSYIDCRLCNRRIRRSANRN